MRFLFVSIFFLLILPEAPLKAQANSYTDSIRKYQDNYVNMHEVVTGKDKSLMYFFPVNEKYRVKAKIEKCRKPPGSRWKHQAKKRKHTGYLP